MNTLVACVSDAIRSAQANTSSAGASRYCAHVGCGVGYAVVGLIICGLCCVV